MNRPLILGQFLIAGPSWKLTKSLKGEILSEQTPIRLQREPYNPHDPLCISVYTGQDHRIGYLRRADNRIPAALLDQGATLTASIAELDLEPNGTPREFRVEIALAGIPSAPPDTKTEATSE